MNSVLEKNIEIMTEKSKESMIFLLSAESIGGSAGHYKNYPCAVANFCINPLTGEIIYFGNLQHVPKEILQQSKRGSLKVAIDAKKSWKYHIVDYHIDKGSPIAKSNLKKTIDFYNRNYGFHL